MTLLARLAPFAAIFFTATTLTRLVLALRAGPDAIEGAADAARIVVTGVWFDMVVFGAFAVPVVLWWILLPRRLHGGRTDRAVTYAGFFLFLMLTGFTAIGEQLFWTEFASRYNFIAVDYLVYTTEVIGNIRESYPVFPLLAGLAAAGLAVTWALRRLVMPGATALGIRARAGIGGLALAVVAAGQLGATIETAERGRNVLADELAKNGVFALFHAFWHNEIDYDRFYRTIPEAEVGARVRRLLATPDSRFETADPADATRTVKARPGGARRKNVVFVVMESLSADYMAHFGNTLGLTPNLDRLADEGLFFADAYATGTRTVRGLEAVTLSVPPTPGQSIVRRPGNDNLYSIGSVFRDLGYDTRFIYGGFGYFDNMNGFYRANGFGIVDRTDMGRDEIRFANVWGVSDQDLFARAIREQDASNAAGRPFFSLIMTTSNHRPYTFPEGEIDAPQKEKTSGVKYADHAIGSFLKAAREKPWFADTLFVFVADHTAGSAGKVELALEKYHIPIIVWSPGFVAPRRHDRAVSQIDLAPTVLGLLGLDYRSRFYGRDVLADPERDSPVFVATYQKVALVRGGEAAILEPNRRVTGIRDGKPVPEAALDRELVADAVAVYQFAADWRHRSAAIPTRAGTASAAR
ncbi:LTA synthase family protein [Prosthecomicrobium sp. N25]|uniref:LTA synthase family protein n=1 Tax=Prosthecomicrobium sp. N25 TaxID=3129254 RepID=UPI003077C0CA